MNDTYYVSNKNNFPVIILLLKHYSGSGGSITAQVRVNIPALDDNYRYASAEDHIKYILTVVARTYKKDTLLIKVSFVILFS